MEEEYYEESHDLDAEILVLNGVYRALGTLPTQDAMIRVLKWICNKFYIRSQFELPRRERLLREGREICGYVGPNLLENKLDAETENNWEEDPVEEVVDLESTNEPDTESEEKES